MKETGYLKDTSELRKLITENPNLPLVVIAGQNANGYDFEYQYCSKVIVKIGELLDCEQSFDDEYVYDDREDFADAVYDYYYNDWDGHFDGNNEEFEDYIEKQIQKYDPYWRKCIIIYADN